MDPSEPRAVLITGVYGSGKSSVGAEIAYVLQERNEPYALLDLDYLGWADAGDGPGAGDHDGPGHMTADPMMLRNLDSVVSNYRHAGIRWFVVAGFVRDRAELGLIRDVLDMPLEVVRLEVPHEEVERRLATDVTTERRDDLRVAAEQIAAAEGVGVEDLALTNDGSVPSLAAQIVAWLGWF